MKIYLATWVEENQRVSLDKKESLHRLLSYFFIKKEIDFLKEYTEKSNENIFS